MDEENCRQEAAGVSLLFLLTFLPAVLQSTTQKPDCSTLLQTITDIPISDCACKHLNIGAKWLRKTHTRCLLCGTIVYSMIYEHQLPIYI